MSSFEHRPVLLQETLAGLGLRSGGRYVDGTLGGAGHAWAILEKTAPSGWLFGCDRDGDALEAASERLRGFQGRYQLRRMTFDGLGAWVEPGSCDGVLLDLGVSSPQLDRAERGFSFQQEGPLDMRMDRRQGTTAADVVNGASVEELEQIFRELGEEPAARRLARAIEQGRGGGRLESTRQLAALVERVQPRGGRRAHPATRVFQALRMVVNDELGLLRRGLEAAMGVLRSGGRLAVITFHSGEDRVVKAFGNEHARGYDIQGEVDVPELRRPVAPALRWVVRKAQQPSAMELESNPRARSAQLRLMERTEHVWAASAG